jgi:hypothetical protein
MERILSGVCVDDSEPDDEEQEHKMAEVKEVKPRKKKQNEIFDLKEKKNDIKNRLKSKKVNKGNKK